MKTIITSLVAALILGGALEVRAQATDETRFDVPIESVKIGPDGNVRGLVFSDGETLQQPQLDAKMLDEVKINRMRRLPFQLLPVGDSSAPQMAVVADFVATLPLAIPAGAEATLGLTPEGKVDLGRSGAVPAGALDELLRCPAGTCPVGGNCYPCLALKLGGELLKCPAGTCPVGGNCYPCLAGQVSQARSYTLIEYLDEASGEARVGVVADMP